MIWHVYYVLEDAVESGQVVCRGVSLIGHACVSKKQCKREQKYSDWTEDRRISLIGHGKLVSN